MSVEPSKEKVVTPPATQSGDPTAGADGKQRRRNRNRRGNLRESRFDGACSELKGHTYDVVFGDTFAKYQHEVQHGDLEQGNEDDSFGQRSVTSITLTTTETKLAGNQQVQWIPDSSWTV